jgi:hypothetical protein
VHVLVALVGATVIVLTLAEFFVAFILPRRVRHEPRIARLILVAGWTIWRFVARRLSELRAGYEPLVAGLSRALELTPPAWLPPSEGDTGRSQALRR